MGEDLKKTTMVAQEALRQYDDLLKAALEPASTALETLRRAAEPASVALRTLDLNLPTWNLDSQAEIMRRIFGPLENLRDRLPAIIGNAAIAQQALANFHVRFELPEIEGVGRLLKQLDLSGTAAQLQRFDESTNAIRRAMEAMHTPWLDMQNHLKSIGGFAELQSIGLAVQGLSSFGEELADRLRVSLGDWRDTITWPKDIFSDTLVRTAFYTDKGFDSRLTDFPAEAFAASVALAGLSGEPPPLLDAIQARLLMMSKKRGSREPRPPLTGYFDLRHNFAILLMG